MNNIFLTIAASDSSSGAGIQQDIRVAWKLGYKPISVLTAITLQDFNKVYKIFPVENKILSEQLNFVYNNFSVSACKIGVLTNKEQIIEISNFLKKSKIAIKILDTVFCSTSGAVFLKNNDLKAFKEKLLPYVTFITPNKLELEKLAECNIKNIQDAVKAAFDLHLSYGCGIYVKGGHFKTSYNYIIEAMVFNKEIFFIKKKKQNFLYSHGTGCAFSSAFAIFLDKYKNTHLAAQRATRWVSYFFKELNKI